MTQAAIKIDVSEVKQAMERKKYMLPGTEEYAVEQQVIADFVEQNKGLVLKALSGISRPTLCKYMEQDLIADGLVHLLLCIDYHDATKGEFSTYAINAIRNEMVSKMIGHYSEGLQYPGSVTQHKDYRGRALIRFRSERKRNTRTASNDVEDITFDLISTEIPQFRTPDALTQLVTKMNKENLLKQMRDIVGVEACDIIYAYYYRGETQVEIAAKRGVSKQRIDQKIKSATKKLNLDLPEGVLWQCLS